MISSPSEMLRLATKTGKFWNTDNASKSMRNSSIVALIHGSLAMAELVAAALKPRGSVW